MSDTELLKSHRCFGGRVEYHRHASRTTGTPMRFSVFIPPRAEREPVPVLYWLSGLTCSEENFTVKAGAQAHAAAAGVILVAPDTSPRGAGVPGEDDEDALGTGAGFYVNATREPWARNYRMYDYVVEELPQIVKAQFPANDGAGIFGHSMGGHGALVIGLRNPDRYASISAFAPVSAPSLCPWGRRAFTAYLGEDESRWRAYDACALIEAGAANTALLVDQGDADPFLEQQLRPGELQRACQAAGHPLTLRLQPGYDHSYFFVATFMAEHIQHHARALATTSAS